MMKVFGNGRFVADPVLRQVGETSVCEFSLAINEYRRIGGEKKKITSFLEFQLWDKGAEVVAKYCRKGDLINVSATPRQDRWEDKTTGQKRSKVIFRIDEFELMSNNKRTEEDPEDAPLVTEGTPF